MHSEINDAINRRVWGFEVMGNLSFSWAQDYSPVENPIAGPSMGRLREAQQDPLHPPYFAATLTQRRRHHQQGTRYHQQIR
jgi:hypothetical protein